MVVKPIAQTLKKIVKLYSALLIFGLGIIFCLGFLGLFLTVTPSQTDHSYTANELFTSPILYLMFFLVIMFALIIHKRLNRQLNKLLRSIEQLEHWADVTEIHEKTSLLKTKDNISVAINKLLSQLQRAKNNDSQIEQRIRQHALIDEETGIGNRDFFTNRLDALLSEEDARGTLLLIQVNELDLVAALHGEQQALILLEFVIQTIKKRIQAKVNYFLARRAEYEIALLLPNAYVAETEKLANKLIKSLSSIALPDGINKDEFIHIGISCFKADQKPYQILAEADMALRSAQLQGPSQWFMFERNEIDDESAKGSLRWRTFLQSAIKHNAFVIFFQPVVANIDNKILHHEVLSKVRDKQGQLINARVFLPMAQKCGLSVDVDMLVVEQACRVLSYEQNQHDDCSLNISVDALLSNDFISKFMHQLKHFSNIAQRLIIEISEYHLVSQFAELEPILKKLHACGIRLLIDKVGQYLVNGNYIKTLPISYIKLHSSIVLKIQDKAENQIFINSLSILCKENKVDIYALGVESIEEWQTLLKLGVCGGQGHFFTEPMEQVARAIEMPE